MWRRLAPCIVVLLLPLAWCAALAATIWSYAAHSDPLPADVAVVLGAAVAEGAPCPVFQERINHAVHLYHAGQVQAIIFTGGVGWGDTVSEAEAARQSAVDQGVPDADIWVETDSHTTYQNLTGARDIVEQRGMGRVLIVSDPLHMRRAVTIARDLGLDAHPAPTTTSRYRSLGSKLEFLLREIYFYTTYLASR